VTDQFKVGDLVILPEESTNYFSYSDYGVVTKVQKRTSSKSGLFNGIYYHIYWAIDQCDTIEDYEWVHQHIKLVQRA